MADMLTPPPLPSTPAPPMIRVAMTLALCSLAGSVASPALFAPFAFLVACAAAAFRFARPSEDAVWTTLAVGAALLVSIGQMASVGQALRNFGETLSEL